MVFIPGVAFEFIFKILLSQFVEKKFIGKNLVN
jgi:hypothetical protein